MAAISGGNRTTILGYNDNSQFASSNWPVTFVGWGFNSRPFAEIDNGTANAIIWNVANLTIAPSGYIAAATVDDDFDPGHGAIVVSGTVTGWHHYAARYTGNTLRDVFFDGGTLAGGQQGTNTANVNLNLSSPAFGLGSTATTAEIACFKSALTDAEIAFLAKGGKPHQLTSHTANLIYYLPMRIRAFDDQVKNVSDIGNHAPVEVGLVRFPYH